MATATTLKKRRKKGGKRPGAGRPPLPNGKAREFRVTFRVEADLLRRMERAANGTPVGIWARQVIDEAAK